MQMMYILHVLAEFLKTVGSIGFSNKKSRGVCETLQYAPGGNKVE